MSRYQNLFISVKAANACEQICQQIAQAIFGGRLRAGARLPSERALAKEFGVSRATLRRAIQILERKALIEVRPGRGTFVHQRSDHAIVPLAGRHQGSLIGTGR
jgi:DNA-binding FadR family transcriptional regulator